MANRAPLGWLLAVALLCAPGAHAEIYRWTDAQGRLHFTQNLDEVPAAQRSAARAASAEPSRVQTYSAPPAARATAKRRAYERRMARIPFVKRGNAMIVEVRVNGRVSAPFLVDTGATDVAIPARVAHEAGVILGPDTPRATYQTANGLVTKPVVTLDSVEAGEVRVEGVRASVSESMELGLLGGTFFNNFTFQVDPAARVITLVRNDGIRAGMGEGEWRSQFRSVRAQLEEVERYLEENQLIKRSRVADLRRRRDALRSRLEELEAEANAADVPYGWRE